ncbi:MAG: HAMP domain-containing protein, partial [Candidatus Omnitrophica bacterium]|nr:HAMP domain-containing protein [Candidatus Omnitrophota bacterium]
DLSRALREEMELEEFYADRYGYRVFVEMFITNKYGVNVAQTGKTIDYYQADEEWWQAAKRDGVYVSDAGYDESSGVYSVDICAEIKDDGGNFLGVMKAVLNIKDAIGILKEFEPEGLHKSHKTMQVKLLTKEGNVIYSSEKFRIFESVVPELLAKILYDKKDGSYFIEKSDYTNGKKELFSYAYSKGYRNYKGLGWILIVTHDTEEVFSPAFRLKKKLYFISFLIAIFSIIVGVLISHSIIKSLKKLIQATIKIGKGDLDARVEIRSKDEVGSLARSFNKMTSDLKKSTTSVNELNKEIANRRQVELDLRTLQRQLEYILGVTKTGIDIIDFDFNIKYIDPEWRKVYGDPAGKKCYEYFMGKSRVCPDCGIVKAFETKERVVTEEILAKEGNRPVQVTTIPFKDEKGNWLVAEVNVDITERKKAEQEIKKAYEDLKAMQEQLIQAEKMAALGTMSAGMAHEINNPLMGVMLLAQSISSEKDRSSPEYKTLLQIENGLKRIADVISKLLAFSRKEKLRLEKENINDVIDLTIPLVLHEFELNKISLVKDYTGNLPLVSIARNPMQQVLMNIFLNAKDAVLKSGNKEIVVKTYLENDMVKVKIKDSGCGIKKEDMSKIFDPFFTTKPVGRGLGIGMSIAKTIIEQHNGKIEFHSEKGQGTEVVVSLPRG